MTVFHTPMITLPDGNLIPQIGLGVLRIDGEHATAEFRELPAELCAQCLYEQPERVHAQLQVHQIQPLALKLQDVTRGREQLKIIEEPEDD